MARLSTKKGNRVRLAGPPRSRCNLLSAFHAPDRPGPSNRRNPREKSTIQGPGGRRELESQRVPGEGNWQIGPQDPQDFTPLQVLQNCRPTLPLLVHDWQPNVQAIGTGSVARSVLGKTGASGEVAACGTCRLARKASSPTGAGLANTIEEVRQAMDMTISATKALNIFCIPYVATLT